MLRKIVFLTLIFAVFTHSKANPFARMARNFAAQKVTQVRKKNFTAQAQKVSPVVPAIDYNINLMWINKELKKDQKYITPDKDNVQDKLLTPIFGWAEKNPESKSVTLWIDSQMTSPQAITNTKRLIDEYNKKNPIIVPIVIEDIRTLPEVIKHPAVFSKKIAVYTRTDLLRVVAAINAVSAGKTKNFVYADLDVTPMEKEELFDVETNKKLEKYGFVMARLKKENNGGFENSFQITSNNKPNLIEAMKYILIELNIKRSSIALANRYSLSPQIVYYSYPDMFKYFCHLENQGTLTIDGKVYNKEKDGLSPFGLKSILDKLNFIPKNQNISLEIPTKEIDTLPTIGNYNQDSLSLY